MLTIHPADRNGDRRWELDKGATLYDVTTWPAAPRAIHRRRWWFVLAGKRAETAFPVAPGGAMPPVEGCTKQDYAVLIVIGVGVED